MNVKQPVVSPKNICFGIDIDKITQELGLGRICSKIFNCAFGTACVSFTLCL